MKEVSFEFANVIKKNTELKAKLTPGIIFSQKATFKDTRKLILTFY